MYVYVDKNGENKININLFKSKFLLQFKCILVSY